MKGINTEFTSLSASVEMEQTEEFTREKLLSAAPNCAKTGFSQLDLELNGGLMPGLIVLGGSPGLGKSTLALYIAEHIASEGTPVLFYSYEMPSQRIKSKLIACRNYEMHKSDEGEEKFFQSKDLFNAETMGTWDAEQWRIFEEACQTALPRLRNLFLIDCTDRTRRFSAKQITQHVHSFITKNPKGKKPGVMIDYLQIIPNDIPNSHNTSKPSRSDRQNVDEKLEAMLSLIDAENIPVILISSLSRAYYKKFLQMDSFKDSGGIEYGADVLLGLQFSACHDADLKPVKEDDWDLLAEQRKSPREVELLILKNRYGNNGQILPLFFYPQYDAFSLREDGTHQEKKSPLKGASEGIQSPQQTAAKKQGKTSNEQTPAGQEGADGHENTNHQKGTSESTVGYINNTKIANLLRKGGVTCNEEHEDMVLPQVGIHRKSAFVKYKISDQDFCKYCHEQEPRPCENCKKELTGYDCNVADAIFTIFRSGEDEFTLRRVLTILTGDHAQVMTENKKKELETSLRKLRGLAIEIDCTDEMDTREQRLISSKEIKFDGPLLTVTTEDEKTYHFSGTRIEDLKDIMPLYAYAQLTRQIITFPMPHLMVTVASDSSGKSEKEKRQLGNTAEVITIKRFLIYRLEVIKNKKTNGNVKNHFRIISFENGSELLKTLGLDHASYTSGRPAWNKKRRQISKLVQTVLDYFVNIGLIKSYKVTPVKQKGAPPSFIIQEK